MKPGPKKLPWGSTKYLKIGSLYLLTDPGGTAFFDASLLLSNTLAFPKDSYIIYLGESKRSITYWQFMHLGLGKVIEAGNNSFARNLLELAF